MSMYMRSCGTCYQWGKKRTVLSLSLGLTQFLDTRNGNTLEINVVNSWM